jgi:hypothetical protein
MKILHVAPHLEREADIVQFEFWNHPRMFEYLARAEFPAMRSVFWSHTSGLSRPLIPPGLMKEAGRFVFTISASLSVSSIAAACEKDHKKFAVITSSTRCSALWNCGKCIG